MKYIVLNLKGEDQIIVFPRIIDHDRMRDAMNAIKFGNDRNWERKYHDAKLVSAGFIDNGICHGKSESLNIKSRPELDTHLFKVSIK